MAQSDESPLIRPAQTDEERDLRTIAVRRIKKRHDFRHHLAVYLTVNAVFWALWIADILNGYEDPWPVIPTFFWGLFVLGQWFEVYRPRHITAEHVEAELQKLRAKRPGLEEYEPHEDARPFDKE